MRYIYSRTEWASFLAIGATISSRNLTEEQECRCDQIRYYGPQAVLYPVFVLIYILVRIIKEKSHVLGWSR